MCQKCYEEGNAFNTFIRPQRRRQKMEIFAVEECQEKAIFQVFKRISGHLLVGLVRVQQLVANFISVHFGTGQTEHLFIYLFIAGNS